MEQNADAEIIDGKFVLLDKLGEGGMGTVYRAYQKDMNRFVAVKLLKAAYSQSDLTRFAQEARAIAQLSHPNIVSLYAAGFSDEGLPYLALELLNGKSLADLLQSQGPLNAEQAVLLFIQACRALAHAHQSGVIHRDIKPSNIFVLDQNPQDLIDSTFSSPLVKLLDFGIAKLSGNAGLTKTNALLGTSSYISPESCTGAKVDERTDLYSLGCSLYECLSGRPPFSGSTQFEIVQNHMSKPPPELSLDTPISAAFEHSLKAIVAGCLEKEVEYRYASAADLGSDLEAALRGQPPKHLKNQAKPTPRPNNCRPSLSLWRPILTIGGAACIMAAGISYLFHQHQDTASKASAQRSTSKNDISRKIGKGHDLVMAGNFDEAIAYLKECCVEASQIGDAQVLSRAAREYMSACANHPDGGDTAERKRLHSLPIPFLLNACSQSEDLLSKSSNLAIRKQSAGDLSRCNLELFHCYQVSGEPKKALAAARKGLLYFNQSDLIGDPDNCHVGFLLSVLGLRACLREHNEQDQKFFADELTRLSGRLKSLRGRDGAQLLAECIEGAEKSNQSSLASQLRKLFNRLCR